MDQTRVKAETLVQRFVQRGNRCWPLSLGTVKGVDRLGHVWGRADRVVAEDKGIKTAPWVLT